MQRIALVSPASCVASESEVIAVQQTLQQTVGCSVEYGVDCFQNLSASDRASLLLTYARRDDIDGLWALRGGEGSADLVPYLEQQHPQWSEIVPKWWLGFSDITAMLLYFSQRLNWPVVHGPCAQGFAQGHLDEASTRSVVQRLQANPEVTCLTDFIPLNEAARRMSKLEATMVAGNLTMLNISVASPWQLEAQGKIVWIEEVNEKPHAIHRTLKYLQRSRVLSCPAALILADMTGEVLDGVHDLLQHRLRHFATGCDYPVWQANHIGHGRRNMAIPFDCMACLEQQSDGCAELTFHPLGWGQVHSQVQSGVTS